MQYQFAYENYVQEAQFDNGTRKYKTTFIPYAEIERKSHISLGDNVEKNHKDRDST